MVDLGAHVAGAALAPSGALTYDPLLAGLSPCGHLPFEDSPSPEVYISIFCQLWGASVGCLEENTHQQVAVIDKIKEDLV